MQVNQVIYTRCLLKKKKDANDNHCIQSLMNRSLEKSNMTSRGSDIIIDRRVLDCQKSENNHNWKKMEIVQAKN